MATKKLNRSLQAAKAARDDEFYTQLSDIEREAKHYKKHFKGAVVYCNCDDPWVSDFFRYFSLNFEKLGLKKLITTCYKSQQADLFSRRDSEHAIYLEYEGDKNGNNVPDPEEIGIKPLEEDGDFRSAESIELLQQADIVVTNPPFSLFREFVTQLIEHDKKFLIIGPKNSLTNEEFFRLVMENRVWLGHGFSNGNAYFRVPDSYKDNFVDGVYDETTGLVKFRNVGWFTNMDTKKRHEDLILIRTYAPENYPRYVNYDAIEVGKTADIPMDYPDAMGVPITFLDHYNPDQFEILGNSRQLAAPMSSIAPKGTYQQGGPRFYTAEDDGTYRYRRLFERIVIRNKRL